MRVSEWHKLAAQDEAATLRQMLFQWDVRTPTYVEWADAVEGALSFIMRIMAQQKNDIQGLSEDALTAQVTGNLRCMGLEANSARVGGNCDVTVRYGENYLWLGEAKIFNGVAHVWGGYLQLTTRYRTEVLEHSRGGMLLYCYKGPAPPLLEEWRATLCAQVDGISTVDGSRQLSFCSEERTQSGATPYCVTHFVIPLFHEPKDHLVKLTGEALKAGREAKKKAASNPDSGPVDCA